MAYAPGLGPGGGDTVGGRVPPPAPSFLCFPDVRRRFSAGELPPSGAQCRPETGPSFLSDPFDTLELVIELTGQGGDRDGCITAGRRAVERDAGAVDGA